MTHPFPPNLGLDDLHPAFFADHPAVFHPLIFPAVTLVILGGAEDFSAEKAFPFGFKGPIVDGLRLFNLPK
jgi:hypothetical protein